jgi:antitoxin (DNA-binding transcriptional repressor) of toxin-antitoxin stability system
MKTIGIRALKAQLSQILKEVQNGETIRVTDRGRVVAEMRLPEPAPRAVEDVLARMAAEGRLTLAETPRVSYITSPVRLPDGTAQDLLDAVREDRF